jgi:hypothetical protein
VRRDAEAPASYAFALLLAGVMTRIVSGLATTLNVGLPPDFAQRWLRGWLTTWAIAFPVRLAVRPFAQRVVGRLTA